MATYLRQVLAQKQKLSPTQVLQAKLLQLNSINLEQAIMDELEINPLLEQIETESNEQSVSEEQSPLDSLDLDPKEVYEDDFTYNKQDENKFSPLPEKHSFLDDIIVQLADSGLSDLDKEIAEEIIWNVNDRGYLDTDLILIADRFGKIEDEIEDILNIVQRLEPKGLGSRNIQECLLIQLEDEIESISWKIVKYLFEDFMHKRYEKIQKKLKCSDEDLHNAIEHISHLNPRPGEGLQDRYQVVIPDLIVREENDGWRIITNDGGVPEVRVNQTYAGTLDQKSISAETKKFMKEKLDSATWFVDAINQRRRTMLNVMKTIIDAFEANLFPKINVKCEPQLGKRGLRPSVSQKGFYGDINTRSDFIAYADGKHSIFDISRKIKKNLRLVIEEAEILKKHNLLNP